MLQKTISDGVDSKVLPTTLNVLYKGLTKEELIEHFKRQIPRYEKKFNELNAIKDKSNWGWFDMGMIQGRISLMQEVIDMLEGDRSEDNT